MIDLDALGRSQMLAREQAVVDNLAELLGKMGAKSKVKSTISISRKELDKLIELVVKHCSRDHYDWKEVIDLTTALENRNHT